MGWPPVAMRRVHAANRIADEAKMLRLRFPVSLDDERTAGLEPSFPPLARVVGVFLPAGGGRCGGEIMNCRAVATSTVAAL